MGIQCNHRTTEVTLPADCHVAELRIIAGIYFTDKEVDTIACLLSGKTVKEIAPLLAIAPKTVNNHLNNIKQKIKNGNSKSLIDFIEKSDKFSLLKQHYANLLIRNSFRHALQKSIGLITQKDKLRCLIFYDKEQKNHKNFASELMTDFTYVDIEASIEEIQKSTDILKAVREKKDMEKNHYMIGCLSGNMMEELQKGTPTISRKISTLNQIAHVFVTIPLFILIENPISDSNKTKELNYIDSAKYENYYHFTFEILKQMLPRISLENGISEFQQEYNRLNPVSQQTMLDLNNSLVNKEKTPDKNKKYKEKNNIWIMLLASMVFFCFLLTPFILIEDQGDNGQTTFFSKTNLQRIIQNGLSLSKKESTVTEWKLPKQEQLFVGRKTLMKELERKLQGPNKTVIVAGLGGVGKTQLALQYIHHNKSPHNLRIWFRCENIQQFQHEYIKLCNSLGFSQANLSIEAAQIFLKNWLAKHPGWLIVYDNVNAYEEIKPFLPEKGGEVIITSRLRNWPNSFEVLSLEVMSEAESLELLKSMINRNSIQENNEFALIELAKSLGHLPLALSQAGAYIHHTQIKIPEYMNLFKKYEADMLANTAGSNVEQSDKISVASTWNISLRQLIKEGIEREGLRSPLLLRGGEQANKKSNFLYQEESPDYQLGVLQRQEPFIALDLLMVCAYLAPEKIPKELLLAWLKEAYPNLSAPELILSNIIGQLGHYSLIKPETDGDIRLHRLLQSVLRNQHKKGFQDDNIQYPALTVQWYNNILNACRSYYLEKYKLKGEVLEKNYLAHLQSLEMHDRNTWTNSTRPEFGRLLRAIGGIISNLEDRKTGLKYYKEALQIAEHHPKNKIELGMCLNNIGANYYWLGDPKQARPFFEQGLKIVKEDPQCEKNHYFYPVQVSNVGQLHSYFGEYKKAKELLEYSRKLTRERYGEGHSSILWNSLWLGELYTNMGETKQALELLNETLKICIKFYARHPEHDLKMAYTLLSLSKAYQSMGDSKTAYEVLKNAIKIYQESYGEEGHVIIGKFLSQLGSVYRDLKEPTKSKRALNQALKIQMKFYEGQEQCPDIMETKVSLGITHNELGDFHQAKKLLEETLQIQEGYYGKTHVNVRNTLLHLSKVYVNLNQPKMAQMYLERGQSIYTADHEKSHPTHSSLER